MTSPVLNRQSSIVNRKSHDFVYGPVPSRRLGLSLGINIIPRKTCTLDCIYCQCGRTTKKTVERRSFYPVPDIIAAVRKSVALRRPDYLTFSGEGEPTLNRDIGRIIRRLKHEFRLPVAVITNGTLMSDPAVRRDLYAADLVMPSLDAADQRTFMKVDRCHRSIRVDDIIAGLIAFRRRYRGKLWLEIMLCKGINDSPEHLMKLRRVAADINPSLVQLNTVVRPPAESFARALSRDDLVQVQMVFGPGTEIVGVTAPARSEDTHGSRADLEQRIIALCEGRPVTRADIARSLGLPPDRFTALLAKLVRSGAIRRTRFQAQTFFEAGNNQPSALSLLAVSC